MELGGPDWRLVALNLRLLKGPGENFSCPASHSYLIIPRLPSGKPNLALFPGPVAKEEAP